MLIRCYSLVPITSQCLRNQLLLENYTWNGGFFSQCKIRTVLIVYAMARKTKAPMKETQAREAPSKARGPVSSGQGRKHKSIEEIMNVEAPNFEDPDDEFMLENDFLSLKNHWSNCNIDRQLEWSYPNG